MHGPYDEQFNSGSTPHVSAGQGVQHAHSQSSGSPSAHSHGPRSIEWSAGHSVDSVSSVQKPPRFVHMVWFGHGSVAGVGSGVGGMGVGAGVGPGVGSAVSHWPVHVVLMPWNVPPSISHHGSSTVSLHDESGKQHAPGHTSSARRIN